jgi:hypothetical protein
VEWSSRKLSHDPLVLDVQGGLASLLEVKIPISEARSDRVASLEEAKGAVSEELECLKGVGKIEEVD